MESLYLILHYRGNDWHKVWYLGERGELLNMECTSSFASSLCFCPICHYCVRSVAFVFKHHLLFMYQRMLRTRPQIRLSFPANPLYELIHHLTRAVSQSSGSIEPISPQFKGHQTASLFKHDWKTTTLILHILWSLGILSN